jgi:pimeloyl-ACP methyl ester carboxylesterase
MSTTEKRGSHHEHLYSSHGSDAVVESNDIRFAYRRWGKLSGLPLVFNHHLNGNLDNWDPAVLDGLAKEREVIIFNNAGVASSTGEVPATFAGMAKNAEAFVDALGLKQIDLLGFSLLRDRSRERLPCSLRQT